MKRIISFMLCIALGAGFAWAGPSGSAVKSFEIEPKEIELGIVSPGRVVHSSIFLKNTPGNREWVLENPEGWEFSDQQKLSGKDSGTADNIVIAIKYERLEEPGRAFVRMVAFTPAGQVKYNRLLGIGRQRLSLAFKAGEDTARVGISFDLLEKDIPVLKVEPAYIDLGSAESGKVQYAQIKIRNSGTKKLHWKVSSPGSPAGKGSGLYLSLQNDEARGKGIYSVPSRLDGMVQSAGNWMERDGYPASVEPANSMSIQFTGNGAALMVRNEADAGSVGVYFDDEWVADVDCRSVKPERIEIPIVEKRIEGPHRIRIVGTGGPVVIEGIRIFSAEIMTPPAGWVGISPDAGDTTGETDYINLKIFTEKMDAGLYAGRVHVTSDGGEASVDVSLRVAASSTPKILTVFRYTRGLDTLFTSSPEREDQRVLGYYRRQGLAFRLFKESTPGTRRLFRWYHPGKGDHYYSSEPEGEKALSGYIHEGSIGNIATSKLPATRELYRWYNPKTGLHLFTLDLRGEGYARKGYRYEGIVGYVR